MNDWAFLLVFQNTFIFFERSENRVCVTSLWKGTFGQIWPKTVWASRRRDEVQAKREPSLLLPSRRPNLQQHWIPQTGLAFIRWYCLSTVWTVGAPKCVNYCVQTIPASRSTKMCQSLKRLTRLAFNRWYCQSTVCNVGAPNYVNH